MCCNVDLDSSSGSNVFCIEIWGCGPILQGLNFIYGIGGLISPLIAAPFLGDQRISEDLFNNVTDLEEMNSLFNRTANFSSDTKHGRVSNITYPFTVVGIIGSLVTALFLATCLISGVEEDRTKHNVENNSNRSSIFMFCSLTVGFLAFSLLSGTGIGFGQTLTLYAVKGKLHMTPTAGSYMTSAFWTAFTISRLICVFLSIKISSMMLLIGDICLMAVSGILLVFFLTNEWTLWAATIIFGTGVASSYASFLGCLDTYIVITNTIFAFLEVGCAAGEIAIPFIITYFIEIVPDMFAYVTVATPIVVTILLLILYGIFMNVKKKINSKKVECYVISKEAAFS